MAISEKNRQAIEETRDELRRVADMLQEVLDGNATLAATGRAIGLSPQHVNHDLPQRFKPYIKSRLMSLDELAAAIERGRSPSDHLVMMIFFPDYDPADPHPKKDAVSLLPDYDPEAAWDVAFDRLTEREYEILRRLCGDTGTGPESQQAVAKAFNVTAERVRQIKAKALRKLRKPGAIRRIYPTLTATGSEILEDMLQDAKDTVLRYYDAVTKHRASNLIAAAARAYEAGLQPDPDTWRQLDEIFNGNPDAGTADLIPPPSVVTLEDADLSVRTYNCLKRANKNTLNQVAAMSRDQIWSVRNIGYKTVEEIEKAVRKHIGVSHEDWLN